MDPSTNNDHLVADFGALLDQLLLQHSASVETKRVLLLGKPTAYLTFLPTDHYSVSWFCKDPKCIIANLTIKGLDNDGWICTSITIDDYTGPNPVLQGMIFDISRTAETMSEEDLYKYIEIISQAYKTLSPVPPGQKSQPEDHPKYIP